MNLASNKSLNKSIYSLFLIVVLRFSCHWRRTLNNFPCMFSERWPDARVSTRRTNGGIKPRAARKPDDCKCRRSSDIPTSMEGSQRFRHAVRAWPSSSLPTTGRRLLRHARGRRWRYDRLLWRFQIIDKLSRCENSKISTLNGKNGVVGSRVQKSFSTHLQPTNLQPFWTFGTKNLDI